MSKPPSLKSHLEAVEDWNNTHPQSEGLLVEVTRDDGRIEQTLTESRAWLLGGHTPVILLAGISGAYRLDRVKFVTPQPA